MSIPTLYPGVYVTEIPSGVRPITGVATSITAFVGATLSGPENTPVIVNGYADYQRVFGGLSPRSTVSFAVRDFFLNGGGQAIVVRLTNGGTASTIDVSGLHLVAASPGSWSAQLQVTIAQGSQDADVAARYGVTPADLFNLTVVDGATNATETFPNLTVKPDSARLVTHVLEADSMLVRITGNLPTATPAPATQAVGTAGTDGTVLGDANYADPGLEAKHQGIWALEDADLFNLLCIPPPTLDAQDQTTPAVYQAALGYCVRRRAMLIVDPPPDLRADNARAQLGTLGLTGLAARNAALYFPRLREPDPTAENRLKTFVPCGAVAGVMARTDASRGVWKAPAGVDATLTGVADLTQNLTNDENGELNPLGINCLRTFPIIGRTVWGSRTLRGADLLADEYKYVPVRRLALYMEESLYRGTQWVVFEPNDEPLWSQIRLNVGAFMQNLFRQGAFEGTNPNDAYFVKCDAETTTVNDRNLGRVNIIVGFAPLRPAEFVILQIQQIARAQA
jgi:phage tail sheath protein FI